MYVCLVTAPHSLPAQFDKQPSDYGGHHKRVSAQHSASGSIMYVTNNVTS